MRLTLESLTQMGEFLKAFVPTGTRQNTASYLRLIPIKAKGVAAHLHHDAGKCKPPIREDVKKKTQKAKAHVSATEL